jgi:hypothetical protein
MAQMSEVGLRPKFYMTPFVSALTASGSASLTAGQVVSLDSFAESFGDQLIANPSGVGFQVVAVPEPASLGLMAAAGLACLGRRRRRIAR